MSSIRKIAETVGMKVSLVRDVLKEVPGTKVSREAADRIFTAARNLKYDLKKLKIGKQMALRKSTLVKVLEQIEVNPDWDRDEIVAYLQEASGMVTRVHKRVFREEYGEDWW